MQNTKNFQLKRKFFKFLGAEMRVLDENDNTVVFAEAKRLKLKEDITLYESEGKDKPLVNTKARQILDIGATYDITDPSSGDRLGSVRRKGVSSFFVRDQWEILDASENVVGAIQEDSTMLGLLRRFVPLASYILPQQYDVTLGGDKIAEFKRSFHIFVIRYRLKYDEAFFLNNNQNLLLAYPVLLALFEEDKS